METCASLHVSFVVPSYQGKSPNYMWHTPCGVRQDTCDTRWKCIINFNSYNICWCLRGLTFIQNEECEWTSYVYYQNLVFLSYLGHFHHHAFWRDKKGASPRRLQQVLVWAQMRLSLRLPVNLFPVFLNLSRGCMEPVSQDVLTVFSALTGLCTSLATPKPKSSSMASSCQTATSCTYSQLVLQVCYTSECWMSQLPKACVVPESLFPGVKN